MTPEALYAEGVRLGEHLRGSATSEQVAMDSLEMDEDLFNRTQFCDGFDATVFNCACCGWWCGTDEMSEGGSPHDPVCYECNSESEEED